MDEWTDGICKTISHSACYACFRAIKSDRKWWHYSITYAGRTPRKTQTTDAGQSQWGGQTISLHRIAHIKEQWRGVIPPLEGLNTLISEAGNWTRGTPPRVTLARSRLLNLLAPAVPELFIILASFHKTLRHARCLCSFVTCGQRLECYTGTAAEADCCCPASVVRWTSRQLIFFSKRVSFRATAEWIWMDLSNESLLTN